MDDPPILLRVLLYARVSSAVKKRRRDAQQDEPSLGEQFEAMEREAQRRRWTVIDRCEDILTGATPVRERPGGAQIYALAEAGAFDLLMVYDNNRLGRDQDAVEAKVFRRDLRRLRKQIYSVHQPLEPKPPAEYDPYGDDSELYLESFSEMQSSMEIRQFRRRRDFGMRKRVQEKKLMPGKLPTGYTAERHVLPNGGAFLGERRADPLFAPIIQRIFHEYETGASALRVAQLLNLDGLRTPLGNRWCAATIRGILDNPTYYGAVAYLKHRSSGPPHPLRPGHRMEQDQPMARWMVVDGGQHPALITREQWERCQEIKRSRAQSGRTFGESTLLSGLVRCGRCGGSMARSGGWGRGYWTCRLARETARTACEPNTIRVDALEEAVLGYLGDLARHPEILSRLHLVPEAEPGRPGRAELERLTAQLRETERRRERARAPYEAGVDTLAEYSRRRGELDETYAGLQERRSKLEQALANTEHRKRSAITVGALLREFPHTFRERPLRTQKAILRELIGRILVLEGAVDVRFRDDLLTASDYERLMFIIRPDSEAPPPEGHQKTA